MQIKTLALLAAPALVAALASSAWAGPVVPGDGVPDAIYDPATGSITLQPDAKIISYVLQTDPAGPGFRDFDAAAVPFETPFITRMKGEISWQDLSSAGFTAPFSPGNILPAGLSEAQLTSFLTAADYASAFGSGGAFNVTSLASTPIPEPASLGLLGLGGLALLRRRRA